MQVAKIELSKDVVTSKLEELSIDLHTISYAGADRLNNIEKRYLSLFRFTIITSGSMVLKVSDTKYELKKGACVIMAPGALSDGEVQENNDCHFITYNFDFITPTHMELFKTMLGLKDNLVYDNIMPDSTIDELEDAFERVQSKTAGCYFFAKLALLRTLAHIIFSRDVNPLTAVIRSDKSSNEEALVLKCHSYVINNSDRNVEVEELCKVFDVSQSYVYKCFKNVLKMSTKEFITLTKIHMTEVALLRTDKSISDIALENGYANSYQYSNIFKRVHGISPSTFRKRNRM